MKKRVFMLLTSCILFTANIPVYASALDPEAGTSLSDLKPFGETRVETYLPQDYQTDNYGNSYSSVLSCNNGYGEYDEVEYNLGGNFGSFTGTFYITKASVDDVGSFESQKPEIRIYGDDVLLYTQKGCSYKDRPEEFLVNTEGVEFLKVVFDGAFYNEGFGWKRPLIVIGDPTLWETPGAETSAEQGNIGQPGVRTRLKELKPFGKTRVETSLSSEFSTDNYGNSYNYVLACNNGYGDYDEVEYYLGEKYKELTGTFYITKASVDDVGNFESNQPEIRIYGDDKLLYTKNGCTSKDTPEEFRVDLNGVEFLKVVFDGAYYNEGFGWKRPLIVMGEPVLWE